MDDENELNLRFSYGSKIVIALSVSQLQFSLEPEAVAINCTAFNHNGNLLVTGAADGMIRLFGMCSNGQINSSILICVCMYVYGWIDIW